ncbi:hypothetical protein HDU76_006685 [Blyttiomyces sp. JEL0837]|nr:hypothetical protein HDU76_006685 [Blyttiomyces sp. JEL0837]
MVKDGRVTKHPQSAQHNKTQTKYSSAPAVGPTKIDAVINAGVPTYRSQSENALVVNYNDQQNNQVKHHPPVIVSGGDREHFMKTFYAAASEADNVLGCYDRNATLDLTYFCEQFTYLAFHGNQNLYFEVLVFDVDLLSQIKSMKVDDYAAAFKHVQSYIVEFFNMEIPCTLLTPGDMATINEKVLAAKGLLPKSSLSAILCLRKDITVTFPILMFMMSLFYIQLRDIPKKKYYMAEIDVDHLVWKLQKLVAEVDNIVYGGGSKNVVVQY